MRSSCHSQHFLISHNTRFFSLPYPSYESVAFSSQYLSVMDFRIRSHSCATNTSNIKLPPLPRITEKQAEKLGLYVGLASRPVPIEHLPKQEYQPPYFFIEITPESTTICAYTNCSSRILVGDYRLAMCPGMSQESMLVKSTGSGTMISIFPSMVHITDTLL